jgi:isoleucyl-tRNA synthetase
VDAVDAAVSQRLTVNARAAGPRLGRDVQQVIKASKSGDWSVSADGVVVAGGIELVDGEYTLESTLAEEGGANGTASGLLPGGGFVVLETTITAELEAEGTARDVIRAIQQARRDAGLEITDRVRLSVTAEPSVAAAVETHRELIMAETLAVELSVAEGPELRIEVSA